MTRHLKEDAKPLHGLPVRMVKRRIVASLLSDLRESRSEGMADHVRSSLSTFFTWVLKEGLMGDDAANPVTYTHKEKARTCADDGRVARDMESDCRRRRLITRSCDC
jgi:site-specific recombinase XerD